MVFSDSLNSNIDMLYELNWVHLLKFYYIRHKYHKNIKYCHLWNTKVKSMTMVKKTFEYI